MPVPNQGVVDCGGFKIGTLTFTAYFVLRTEVYSSILQQLLLVFFTKRVIDLPGNYLGEECQVYGLITQHLYVVVDSSNYLGNECIEESHLNDTKHAGIII